jgi:hypothetical protein
MAAMRSCEFGKTVGHSVRNTLNFSVDFLKFCAVVGFEQHATIWFHEDGKGSLHSKLTDMAEW